MLPKFLLFFLSSFKRLIYISVSAIDGDLIGTGALLRKKMVSFTQALETNDLNFGEGRTMMKPRPRDQPIKACLSLPTPR